MDDQTTTKYQTGRESTQPTQEPRDTYSRPRKHWCCTVGTQVDQSASWRKRVVTVAVAFSNLTVFAVNEQFEAFATGSRRCLFDRLRLRVVVRRIALGPFPKNGPPLFARNHYCIPYIDIGLTLRPSEPTNPQSRLSHISGNVFTAIPGGACLWCTGFLSEKALAVEAGGADRAYLRSALVAQAGLPLDGGLSDVPWGRVLLLHLVSVPERQSTGIEHRSVCCCHQGKHADVCVSPPDPVRTRPFAGGSTSERAE